ncbi:hypothetical protein [Streptomyces sp. NPDC101776]|uniref:hypothetical protein n=1 Tax=Streptomyces sp. NPDC101776 TaxID=3366146 RepID=UPI003811E48D
MYDTYNMHNPFDKNFTSEPPADLPLSHKVKGLREAYQDAEAACEKCTRENSRYHTRDVRTIGETEPRYSSTALEEATSELRELEIVAVEAGKPLPDKEKHLDPIKAKMDEYKRTVQALKALAQKAKQEYSEALFGDLKAMGLKEAEKAAKAHAEYKKAYEDAINARATLKLHADLFAWCVSSGLSDSTPLSGESRGDNIEAWALTDDGRLSFEASQELGYYGKLVVVPGIIEEDPNPPEPVAIDLKYTMPSHYYSRP